jgi:outer membrane protein assembly factor BamB
MRNQLRQTLLILFALTVCTGHLYAENWPLWRGPHGNGISDETNVVLRWNEPTTKPAAMPAKESKDPPAPKPTAPTEPLNILWKTPLPDYGRSTPALWNDAIFLTSHIDDKDMVVLKINKTTGQIEWTRKLGTATVPRKKMGGKHKNERRNTSFHTSENYASPSPVTDGQTVVTHFGNGLLVALDFDGNELWRHNLQDEYGPFSVWWGRANSPIIYQDLVITPVMQDPCRDLAGEPSPGYVVAHELKTGEVRWRVTRSSSANFEAGDSYTTPLLHKVDGRTEMILMGSEMLNAYDPATGQELWRLTGITGIRPVTGPVAVGRTIFATHGKKGPFFAFQPKGDGVQSADGFLWKHKKSTPDSPCPIAADGVVYWVNDSGIAFALDAKTGEVLWKERLAGAPFRASPVLVDGRLYFPGTRGITTVVRAGREFEKLAENHLDDELYASPVVDSGRIYLRGRKSLYCLGKDK